MDNRATEKTELVIKALDYAHKHNLDINDKAAIKKILEQVDPEHTDEHDVDEFMLLLQNADMFMEMTAKKKFEQNDLPN